jgi:hypothetical protein
MGAAVVAKRRWQPKKLRGIILENHSRQISCMVCTVVRMLYQTVHRMLSFNLFYMVYFFPERSHSWEHIVGPVHKVLPPTFQRSNALNTTQHKYTTHERCMPQQLTTAEPKQIQHIASTKCRTWNTVECEIRDIWLRKIVVRSFVLVFAFGSTLEEGIVFCRLCQWDMPRS